MPAEWCDNPTLVLCRTDPVHYSTAHTEHGKLVQASVGRGARAPVSTEILNSWRRCLKEYGLDPDGAPRVLHAEKSELSERKERLAQLLAISRAEMANLYQQIAGSGYAVILTDCDGVVLHVISDPLFANTAHKAGLQLGAVWSEQIQGTNGMGTCLVERKPLAVHHDEHFFSRNTILTCSAAPIFSADGELIAVLDASGESNLAQQHTVALVNMSAQSIENRFFVQSFNNFYILRFHSRPEFVNTLGEGLIAFDDTGAIASMNQSAMFQLGIGDVHAAAGSSISAIFDRTPSALIQQSRTRPYSPTPIRTTKDGRRFYVAIHPADPQAAANPQTIRGNTDSTHRLRPRLDDIIQGDTRMAENVARAKKILDCDIPILLRGETGTGKDLFAKAFHFSSSGEEKPFVAINCAAIPETLIESELFGYRPGAFTGAGRRGHSGKITQADGGTLFLDEIGDMPLHLQARLLRVLEDQEVVPLGGDKPVKVNFRLVAATNRDLSQMVTDGRFRQDLYYRLNGISLTMPPLRERTDLRRLVRYLLALDFPDKPVTVTDSVMEALQRYDWPGNIRQLRHTLRIAGTLCNGHAIEIKDLPAEMFAEQPGTAAASSSDERPLLEAEKDTVLSTLREVHWNVTKAAKVLNVSRNTLYRKMRRHGITPPR